MSDEARTPEVSVPEDFAAYEKFRAEGAREPEPVKSDEKPSEVAEADKPAAETDSESETEKEEQEQPKKQGGFQRRIKQLTDRIKELEAQRSVANTVEKPAETVKDAKPDAKPKLSDFDTYEEYEEKRDEWNRAQLRKELIQELRAAEAEKKAAEEQKAQVSEWTDRIEKTRKVHADYDEVLAEAEDVAIPPAVQAAIVHSDMGPELAYALCKDREKLEAIAAMDPVRALVALGKFEATLSQSPVKEQKPAVSKAPKPPTPVGGSKGATPSITDENISFRDYERLRREQLARR